MAQENTQNPAEKASVCVEQDAEPIATHTFQCSFVEKGSFEITIDGKTAILTAGDSFLVPSDQLHGAKAVTAGTLVDVFTPMREDFLS